MPGNSNAPMTATTSSVITPKSSARMDNSGIRSRMDLKNRSPGPGIQTPFSAVGSQAGTCQNPQNPRK